MPLAPLSASEERVAEKKDKRPALRYLLSADHRLRKLSLKKLSQQPKKAAGTKRASRSKAVERPAAPMAWLWSAKSRAVGLTAVGLVAAVTLFAAGDGSERPDAADEIGTPASEPRMMSGTGSPAPARAAKPVTPAKLRTPERTKPAAAVTPVADAGISSAPAPESEAPGSVTVTGCLAKSKDGFWLKNASGAELPKARSWRTGFVKKNSPRIDVVPASATVNLASHVGRRISAAGVLADHELRARTVRRIASTCN